MSNVAVAIGDSLTAGWFHGEQVDPVQGYMYSLPSRFTSGVTWYDRGYSGYNTTNYLSTYWSAVLSLKPRWATIMFGTNDQNVGIPAATTYSQNLHRMFTELRAIGCEPILLTSPPWFYVGPPPTAPANQIKNPYNLNPYVDAANAQAAADGVAAIQMYTTLLDIYNALGYTAAYALYSYTAGGNVTHWNATGAAKAADVITAALLVASPSLAAYLTPTAASTFATLAQLKAAAGITVSTYDTDLTLILQATTKAMQANMRRKIIAATYDERYSMQTASVKLYLQHSPIVEVHSIREDGAVLFQNTDYYVSDKGQAVMTESGWTAGSNHLRVRYTAGYAVIPEDLVEACIAQARYQWTMHKDGGDRFGLAQRAEASGGSTAFVVQDWYPGVLAAMASYRRLV